MNETYANCPNCSAAIKSGMFASNELIDSDTTAFINFFLEKTALAYCEKCQFDFKGQAGIKFRSQSSILQNSFQELLTNIPIITLQNPLNWKYTVVRMVTSQSITGTGVVTEIASAFTDLFGLQSKKYNEKIKHGESICRAQLRMEALEIGANAIIATDIDYTEVGGDKGMLMVCMSGTAIKLENLEILGNNTIELLRELHYTNNRIKEIAKFSNLGGLA